MAAPHSTDAAGYTALGCGAACLELTGWTSLVLRGTDRALLLHNLCTNDIRSLVPGTGCEAFLTNVQARILAQIWVLCQEHQLRLVTLPDQADTILAHLNRYIIREQVEPVDETPQTAWLLLGGPQATKTLQAVFEPATAGQGLPQEWLHHGEGSLAGQAVTVCRTDLAGPVDYVIGCPLAGARSVRQLLLESGATAATQDDFETARIEYGTPLYGADISAENLPQEVGRDQRAIHFRKGCYLGQETVARIDALGHVNRLLVGVRFPAGDVPRPVTPLWDPQVAEKQVGHVTSAAYSPCLGVPLALAYVRRGFHEAGSKVAVEPGIAEVVRLPLTR